MNSKHILKAVLPRISLLYIALLMSAIGYSQQFREDVKPDRVFAKYCLKFHNYHDGLKEFEGLLRLKPNNDYYRWGVGYCHLNLNKDKSAAIPFFKTILSKQDADQSIWYDLGNAYFQTNQLDKAQEAFKKFIASGVDDKHLITAKRQLMQIKNAREAFINPLDVKITNAGEIINTKYPDFSPFINSNEKFMVFSRQSPANSGRFRHDDGYYASDVYYSNFKFGRWKKVRKFSSVINTTDIELNGYLSKSASFLYIYTENLLGKEKKHIIYNKRGRSYGHPKEIMIDGVNMQKVKSLAISNDGKHLIFSAPSIEADRDDLDLFYSEISPDGYWKSPIAFDSSVNSIYNEAYPYFAPNEHKFVFASQGHNSIGGYDLFFSDITIDSAFHLTNITNIGYPVNTTMDDKTITFNSNSRYAYISNLREGGYGDLDIYRVVFNDKQALLSVIHGSVFDQDSTEILQVLSSINDHIDTLNFPINKEYKRILLQKKDSITAKEYLTENKIPHEKLDIKIIAIDKSTNKIAGKFIVKESNGTYAVILSPGKYRLVFSRKNFRDRIIDDFIIDDFDLRNRNIERHILMDKI